MPFQSRKSPRWSFAKGGRAAAVAELQNSLDVVQTNAPINEKEGNHRQAKLERSNAESFKAAIRRLNMKGQHCHKNGTCHDHPNDGKDYG